MRDHSRPLLPLDGGAVTRSVTEGVTAQVANNGAATHSGAARIAGRAIAAGSIRQRDTGGATSPIKGEEGSSA
jgi:hypothetical protein